MIWAALEIIFSILFFYYHNYLFLFIIVVMIFISFKRNTKNVFIVTQILVFIFCLFRFTYFNVDKIEEVNYQYLVIEKYDKYVILENDDIKYLYYDTDLDKGNEVTIVGEVSLIEETTDFNKYLKSQKINYLVEGMVICNDNYVSFNQQIINRLLENKDEENRNILKLVLFGEKDVTNEQFYKYFEIFSISFLLVISGYHINLIFKILDKTKIIKYVVTLFYLYLLNFSVSSLKAFLYYVLKRFNNRVNYIINNSDILSLIMITLLIINPGYCFNRGFIYSFTFSFIIEFLNNIIVSKKKRTWFLKKIFIYLSSVPIILLNSYQININSFLASLVLVYPISFLFVFSFIYLFLDKFYLIYKLYVYLIEIILSFLTRFSIDLVFGKPNIAMIIIFYSMLILFLYYYQNKLYRQAGISISIYLLCLILQYNLPNLDFNERVYFLDVGQGDCSILKIKNSKKVVLIDTGGSRYKDLANETIIPFLKSKGIDTIDKIVISHDDFDHNGSLNELLENIKVNELVDNSLIEEIYIGENKFINLNVSENRDNDGSIVLYGEYGGIKYLFSGDISKDIEIKIIEKNPSLEVDILKVSHHGSKSSTSEEFLQHIRAKVALIGVGKNNIYNHPSIEVINRLEKYNLLTYLTSKDGTITIYKSLFSEQIIIEKG